MQSAGHHDPVRKQAAAFDTFMNIFYVIVQIFFTGKPFCTDVALEIFDAFMNRNLMSLQMIQI